MIIHDAATLVRTVYSLYNAHQTDTEWLDKTSMLVSENCESVNASTGHIRRGKEGFRQCFLNWSTAFPDSSNEITNVVATNDQAAVEFISRGTQSGVLHTPKGDIQPTHRTIELRCCDVYRMSNNEIVTLHSYYDALGLQKQLGLTPAQQEQRGESAQQE
jgi:predicted ester cyclase